MRRTHQLTPDPVDARQFEVAVKHLANSLDFGQVDGGVFTSGVQLARELNLVEGTKCGPHAADLLDSVTSAEKRIKEMRRGQAEGKEATPGP